MPRRNRGGFVFALMLAGFMMVQSSVICALDCLKHGHVAMAVTHNHHHGQACHDGPQLRNEQLNSGPLAEVLPARWVPNLPSASFALMVSGPATLAEPQHVVRAEPPPPRPV